MASGKRRRRRSGHPAKLAERRERDGRRRGAARDPALRLADRICREAAALECALDAELWGSALLGSFWPPDLLADTEVELGEPLVERVERIGGEGALAALTAIAELAETELGPIARRCAERLRASGVAAPAWRRRSRRRTCSPPP